MPSAESKSFIIKHRRSSFYGVIDTYSPKYATLHVGGKKKGCVTIEIAKRGKILEGTLNVHYDRRCNTDGDLERGVGTRGMLQAAITFAFTSFPKLSLIALKDNSYVSCANHGDMELAPMQLVLHEKTWYMRHVQAEPEDDHDKATVNRIVAAAKDPLGAFSPFWETVIMKRIKRLRVSEEVLIDWKRRIRAYWKSPRTTLHELIGDMKAAGECELFKYWLSKYLLKLTNGALFNDIDFVIHRSKFTLASIEISATDFPYGELLEKNKAALQRKLDLLATYGGGIYGKYEYTGIRFPLGKDATMQDFDDVMNLPVDVC